MKFLHCQSDPGKVVLQHHFPFCLLNTFLQFDRKESLSPSFLDLTNVDPVLDEDHHLLPVLTQYTTVINDFIYNSFYHLYVEYI